MQRDPLRESLFYVYRYRNEYLVLDNSLNKNATGHTIDTNSRAKVRVGLLNKGKTRQLASPPQTVNVNSSAYRDWLFIQSDVPAKNEHRSARDKASVIDVYERLSNMYLFSFYIYDHAGKERLRQFDTSSGYVLALVDYHGTMFELRSKYVATADNLARANRMSGGTPVKASRSTLSTTKMQAYENA